jgi:hypothetical protein
MLTLFKPWRSGKDMKYDNYSLDDTFIAHDFTPHLIAIWNISISDVKALMPDTIT